THPRQCLALVPLQQAFRAALLVLKLSPGALEGIVDGEDGIAEPLVDGRRPLHIDAPSVGKLQVNADLILPTGAMVPARRLHHDAAPGDPSEAAFQQPQLLVDPGANSGHRFAASEIDLDRNLHRHSPHWIPWTRPEAD